MTAAFPEMRAAALTQLPANTGLDGELVVWESDRLAFERLQQRLARRGPGAVEAASRWPAHYVVFDLVRAGGDVTGWPYERRRAALEELFADHGRTLAAERAADLDELGVIWDPAEAAWEENLAAARAYYADWGTLAAPVTATALDKPVGQWLANCRKGIALGNRRAAQLAGLDEDWRPGWPVDWQRTYAGVAGLLEMGAALEEIVPGVTSGGVDVGRWLQRQREHAVWQGLAAGQRERLAALGVRPLPLEPEAPVKPVRGASGAFERGCAALEQYRARTGSLGPVSRQHTETLPDGSEVRLGVWLANSKTRRAKLPPEHLERLGSPPRRARPLAPRTQPRSCVRQDLVVLR